MDLQLALPRQAAVAHTKIHQHISQLLVQVAQDLLAVTVLTMAAVVVVVRVVLVLRVEMELHQLQQHLQAVLA
jgi:hypothetical protein